MELKLAGWQKKRLDDLANIRSGGTPSTNVPKFWDGAIPWCTPTDITRLNGGKYLAETSRTISQEGLASSSAEVIPENSVVMTSRATIGECAINTVPVTTNQGFKNFIPFDSTDIGFLYYLLQTQKQGFIRLCAGSTFLEIGKTQLAAYEVYVPAQKEEQSAIAAALGDVDALLSALDALIAKQRDLKAAAMQQLPTCKARLPGFGGEWETKLLGDLADVKTGPFGSALHERDYVSDGTPIITVEHLGERGVEHVNLPMVSGADRKRLSAYSLEVGDIVFSRVGSVDRNAMIREAESGWLFSGRLLRVRPDRRFIHSGFLSYQFHSERFKFDVLSVAVGQTMASLNTKILNGLSVHLPSIEEQVAIAEVLGDMDVQLAALEQQREKTALLKQGMMQELLTGRTRLV